MKSIVYTISLLILFTTGAVNRGMAAPDGLRVDTTDANESLKALEAVFDNVHLECFVSYSKTHADSSGTTHNLAIGTYNFLGSNFRNTLTFNFPPEFPFGRSLHHIQNSRESITVETDTKMISLNKHVSAMQAAFHLDLLDTLFVNAHVQRMYTIDSADRKIIKVEFRPESPYLSYSLRYDPNTLFAEHLDCSIRYDDGTISGGYDRISVSYGSYTTTNPVSYSTYLTDLYFTRINGVYVLTPSYAEYEILDLSAF